MAETNEAANSHTWSAHHYIQVFGASVTLEFVVKTKSDCERSLKVQHRSGLRFVREGQAALVIHNSALPRLFFDAAVHERQFRNHQHFQSGIGQDTILGSDRPGIELDLAMAFWTRLTF